LNQSNNNGWYYIEVAFEEEDDKVIWFGKNNNDPQSNYILVYLENYDTGEKWIDYGGERYEFNFHDYPYLLIKMDQKLIETNTTRKAKGRTLQ
jgi:hypothetical protein